MLVKHYSKIRSASIHICRNLKTEDFVAQPEIFISPPKWHLAHTTWFFEQFALVPNKKGYKLFNNKFPFLFNSYYETIGERIPRNKRGTLTRPEIDEILNYRRYVDAEMIILLDGKINKELFNIINLGLQHEQQHQELLITDIKFILGNNPLFPNYHNFINHQLELDTVKPLNFLAMKEGNYEIGFNEEKGFCFDNELGNHKVFLHEFQISNRLITNSEYQEFIIDEGYTNHKLWLADGWNWIKENRIDAPLYWHQKDDDWFQYTLNGLEKINPTAPVTHVSYYEAEAFARWKNKRLPTEFEWETACKKNENKIPKAANLANNEYYEPAPAKTNQFYGDCWEWTSSAYLPYPFYKKSDGALGEYNGKFMINQMVLRGGSCATPADHIRATYRNFFYPHERWQFTGIRLAEHL